MNKKNHSKNFSFTISRVVNGKKEVAFTSKFNCYFNEPSIMEVNEDGLPTQNSVCFKHSWENEQLKENLINALNAFMKSSATSYMTAVYNNTQPDSFYMKNDKNINVEYCVELFCDDYPLRGLSGKKLKDKTTTYLLMDFNFNGNIFPYNETHYPTFYKIWGDYVTDGVTFEGLRTIIMNSLTEKYFNNKFTSSIPFNNPKSLMFNV